MIKFVLLFLNIIAATELYCGNILAYTSGINPQDAATSFPYTLYWKDNTQCSGADILVQKALLDSMGLDGRRIIYNLYGPMLLKVEGKKQFDYSPSYLAAKVTMGQQFMDYADMAANDAGIYRAIGTLWLQHVCNVVSDTVTANPKLAYNNDYVYVIKRLQENKFAPTLPPESSLEKAITTVAENEWGHLAERFVDRTSFITKVAALTLILLLCVGLATVIRISISRLKSKSS